MSGPFTPQSLAERWACHPRTVRNLIRKGGAYVEKWMPTHRMGRFRAAWVPEPLRGRVCYMRGDRAEMEARAAELNAFADDLRETQTNRRNASTDQ